MATFKTKISLWVRSELFAYGALPVPPHPRLSVHNIKKIIPYAKSKGKSGFPRLGYSVWKNIACNKLQLPMDLAWMYFVTFDMLVVTTPEEKLERDEMFAQCSSQQELELYKCRMSHSECYFVELYKSQMSHSECYFVELYKSQMSHSECYFVELCKSQMSHSKCYFVQLCNSQMSHSECYFVELYKSQMSHSECYFVELYKSQMSHSECYFVELYKSQMSHSECYFVELCKSQMSHSKCYFVQLCNSQMSHSKCYFVELCNSQMSHSECYFVELYKSQMSHSECYFVELCKSRMSHSECYFVELCKSRMSVPLLRFVLFLYLQHFHKISLRSSLVSGNVEWPVTSQPPELDTRSSSARGKSLDEHSHMTFVLNNLKEILDLLAEPDGSSETKEMCLSVDAVEALGFIIAGSVDGNRTEKALQEIAMMQQVYQKSGYSKPSSV
ncbi:hypothetical protein LSAT2_021908 [Lamellibrachia satsuma]|nr:hypothetical protein LSAT2_021908 [Lamellibrachia satsuma]